MTMRITAPVAGYSGDGPGGIQFLDGIAETDDIAVIGYCQGAGYDLDPLDDTAPPDPEPEPDPAPNAPQAKPAGRSASRRKGDA
ncbi:MULTISPECIES: hypothetical protein [Streptomyces]|uniref:Uncharacterized protein n=1 Tax=Streptomyces dengpaensis TaxID=2049881 RepID=A0ABN5I5T2_9ACTN|nr:MULTISPECIES: hypothetical protein [Streptomyces]AVH58386.1 hypothetical protein C4B68_24395 [Streptomyces dengpaensis]PIB06061.1 hypothetical protein B1C81_26115 [Streptomyces sp. HG99]